MKRSIVMLALVLVPLLTNPLAGQIEAGRREDPLEMLLELRRQLDLTRSQVSSLREIQRRFAEINRPLIAQIQAIQEQVRSDLVAVSANDRRLRRRPSDTQLHAARIPMETIRRNNLAAMEEVNALLTDEQKRRAAILLQMKSRRPDRRPPDWPNFGGD